MADPLVTYIQDHLAGAKFAVGLLTDLSGRDGEASALAAHLLPEIESDRSVLEDFVKQLGGDPSALKEAAAWFSQKAGRLKFALDEPLSVFEAIEMLSLGVLGKLALWTALKSVAESDRRMAGLDLNALAQRALAQHQQLESLRLKLAVSALRPAEKDDRGGAADESAERSA